MQLSPSIFKAYDIRGIVPSTLNEDVAEALGRAFGTVALREGEKTVAVGRDGRLSGPSLSAALVRGLLAVGIDVVDVGMVTTPMLYFAANTVCTSGMMPPPPIPWTARPRLSTSMLGASAHMTEPAVNSPSPASSMVRRP